jgi:hypothetical protein
MRIRRWLICIIKLLHYSFRCLLYRRNYSRNQKCYAELPCLFFFNSMLIIVIMVDDDVPGAGRILCRNSRDVSLSCRRIASVSANWPGPERKLGHTGCRRREAVPRERASRTAVAWAVCQMRWDEVGHLAACCNTELLNSRPAHMLCVALLHSFCSVTLVKKLLPDIKHVLLILSVLSVTVDVSNCSVQWRTSNQGFACNFQAASHNGDPGSVPVAFK